MIRDAVRQLRDPTYALFLVAVAVNLIRAPNQPSVELGRGGTTLSVTPGDVLLGILLVVVLVELGRGRRPSRASLVVLGPAAAFSLWLFASALPNGGTATVAAGKLVEVAVLTVAAALVLDRPERLLPLTLVIVAMTVAVAGVATIGGLNDPGRRQESFLGEHPMALLCTYSLVLAFLAWLGRDVRLGRLPLLAGVFGAAGIVFGASFSGLLGVYLVAGAMLVIAFARASLRLRAVVAVLLVCAGITGATLTIRSDNLGFLQEWFGDTEQLEPGATAGSWSSRLIFAYVGMRIFLDHPIAGTGWYG